MSHSEYAAKLTAFWLQFGVGAREAIAKLQRAYGDHPVRQDILEKLETEWQTKPDATQVIYALLSSWKRLDGFDTEDVVWPAEHDHVVSSLAKITGNQFTVDDVVQTVEPNGDIRLSMTHRGASHSFVMANNGTWLNLPGTLGGLNHILTQLEVPERFIELYTGGGQGAVVTFVRPDKFLSVARELGIQLESTPGVE